MRELLFADVDGTILPSGESRPSERTIAAVQNFHKQGGRLIPVTSNSAALLQPLADALQLRHLGILDGGATLYNYATRSRDEELSRWLDGEKAGRIVAALRPFISEIYYDELSQERTPETIDLEEVADTPSVFAIYNGMHEPALLEGLARIPGISWHPNRYEETNDTRCVQVVEDGVSKQSGVGLVLASEEYRHYLGKDMGAIGDGENDKHLMQALPPEALTMAMGNAGDVLKSLAKITVGTDRQDGFAQAIEQHMLGAH